MTDLNELKAKAEAATPGPWRVEDSPWMDDFAHWEDCDRAKQVWAQNEDGEDEEMLECNDRANHPGELTGPFTVDVGDYYALSEANADYIAAVSPDVVLELIAEVKRLRDERVSAEMCVTRWEGPLPEPKNHTERVMIESIRECAREYRAALREGAEK